MMYFRYKLHFYNDFLGEENFDEGIVAGVSYGDAAEKVVKEYGGKDTVIDIHLYEIVIEGDYCIGRSELEHAFGQE